MPKYFAKIDSTQKYLINNIDDFVLGEYVYSDCQTAGYGRSGLWDGLHKNIYFSKVMSSDLYLWLKVIVSMHDLVSRYLPGCYIKIPNDIYYKEKKVAGFLIDKVNDVMVIGIGINVFEPETKSRIGIGIRGLKIADLVKELNFILDEDVKLSDLEESFLSNTNIVNRNVTYQVNGIIKTGKVEEVNKDFIVIDSSKYYLDQIKLVKWL